MRKDTRPIIIKKWHVIALSTALSILIIIGAYFYFSYEEQTIHSEKHNELKAIAELKISQISSWNKEILSDAKMFSQSSFFANGLENWLGSKSNLSVKSEILKRLDLINSDSLYSDVLITDAKGKLFLSLNSTVQQIDTATEKFILKAIAKKKILGTDLYMCQPHNQIHLDYIAPVTDKNNVVIATLILRVNPDSYLYPLINEWPATSKTSETMIVRKDGDDVLYLNQLSHQKNTALKLRIPLTRKEVPAVKAVLGFQGIFEGISYRGAKVLAYISPIDDTPWIMIAQEDDSEIYTSLYFREKVIISFTVLLIIVLSVGLIWYYHYRQRNIYRELFDKEKELREYHEEFRAILYSIGDGVITTDTNGNVKQMNFISEKLTGWNEAEAIGKPIEEVFKIINEGTRDKVENPVHKVLREGVIIGLANHTLLISQDGRETPIADSGAPIRDEKGEIEGVVLVFRDNTEEHTAEKLIKQSEARLKRAELASKSGNWELHLDTKMMIASEGAAKIYGVDWNEVDYEVAKKVPFPEYRSLLDNALKNLIENDIPYDLEYKIRTVDSGEIKDIHSVAQFDKVNRILFGVIQDITERKKAETELVNSEEKMRMIVEGTPHLFFYTQDINAEVTYVSPSVETITGYSVGQWLGQKHWFVTDSEINRLAKEKTYAHLRGEFIKEPVFIEIAHANGSKILLEIYENPIIKENKVVGIHGVAHDITERKKNENALKEREAFLNNLLATMPIPVFYKDTKGNYIDANNSFVSLFGYSKEQLIGKSIFDIYPKELATVYLAKDKELFENPSNIQIYESRFLSSNGEPHDVVFHKAAFSNDKGEIAGLIGAVLDITERKHAEENLRESNEKYTSLFNSMNEGAVLHELIYDEHGKAVDYKIIEMNPSFEKHTGIEYETAINKLGSELYGTSPAPYLDVYSKVAETKEPAHFDTFFPPLQKYFDISVFSPQKGMFATIFTDITESKLAAEKIEQSEKRFRSIVENTDAGYFFIDKDGIIKDVNEAWIKLYKYDSRDEIVGKHFTVIQRIDESESAKVFVDGIMNGNKDFMKGEFSRKCKDGSFGYHSFSAKPVNYLGNVIGIEGFIIDITERKRAEEALKKAEALYRDLVETAQDLIWQCDAEGRYTFLNHAWKEVLGYEIEELIGKKFADFQTKEWAERDLKEFEKLLKGNTVSGLETIHIAKDGRKINLVFNAKFIHNDAGNIVGTRGTAFDITKRKRAEEALRESEERHRTTLYSIGDGVIATSNRGFINQMNPIAENLTGWSEQEAKNKPLEEVFKIINETTRSSVENPVHKVLKEGKIVGLANHTLLISKDGTEIPIADSGAPIRNENGDIGGVVLVFRDQLKERAAQKILEESEAQLRQSQRVARIGYYIFEINSDSWTSSEMLDELFGIDKNFKRTAESWLNLVHPEQREEMALYLTNHILKEKKGFNKEYRVQRDNDKAALWVHGLGTLEFDEDGNPIKMFGTIQDVTETKKSQNLIETSLKEKEILLKEIHHRVKNNFQRIISLIALQTELIDDRKVLDIFEDLQNRLRTMSLIHELMYGTGDFVGVDVKNYITRLTNYLVKTYSSSGNVKLNLDLESHSLDLDTIIPCGLIANEIVTNSLKYAFPNETEGTVNISFKKVNGEYCLEFFDNGIGIKNKIDFENINSLGLRLVDLLAKQLRGTLEVVQPGKGLQFIIKFKGEL